jgi:hypothetical protein
MTADNALTRLEILFSLASKRLLVLCKRRALLVCLAQIGQFPQELLVVLLELISHHFVLRFNHPLRFHGACRSLLGAWFFLVQEDRQTFLHRLGLLECEQNNSQKEQRYCQGEPGGLLSLVHVLNRSQLSRNLYRKSLHVAN